MARGFVNVSSVVESAREMVWWFVYVSSVVCFERLPNPQILQDAGMWSPLLFDLLTVHNVLGFLQMFPVSQ